MQLFYDKLDMRYDILLRLVTFSYNGLYNFVTTSVNVEYICGFENIVLINTFKYPPYNLKGLTLYFFFCL